jgi:hypothetical protein
MSSSTKSHAFFFHSVHFTLTSNDEKILDDMDQKNIMIFHHMLVVNNFHDFFNSHEMDGGEVISGPND